MKLKKKIILAQEYTLSILDEPGTRLGSGDIVNKAVNVSNLRGVTASELSMGEALDVSNMVPSPEKLRLGDEEDKQILQLQDDVVNTKVWRWKGHSLWETEEGFLKKARSCADRPLREARLEGHWRKEGTS